MTSNVLFFCIEEFVMGFIYALILVCLLEWVFVLVGFIPEFDTAAALSVSAVISLINLCYALYHIQLLSGEEE
jgi:hypothetical protein